MLEVLREPLESGHITISRAARQADFPARFQLVAAMNPCPCGNQGHPTRACRCGSDAVARYRSRISGPLLDRIDLRIEVPSVDSATISALPDGEPSAAIAARVALAHERQIARQGLRNARLVGKAIDLHCTPDAEGAALLLRAMTRLEWSARAYHSVLKIGRTIADLDGRAIVTAPDIAEAIGYRRAL